MAGNRIIRRVTKRVYDQYNFSDYSPLPDNLNPINPTTLESQYKDLLNAVQKKVVEAYEKAKVTAPEELFSPDISPNTLLNDIDELISKIKGSPLKDLYDDLGSLDVIPALVSVGKTDPIKGDIFNNPLKLDCSGVPIFPRGLDGSIGIGSSDKDGSNTDGEGSGSGSSEEDNKGSSSNAGTDIESPKLKITYVGLEESYSVSDNLPTELLFSELPVEIPIPDCIGANGKTTFKGWFLDSLYNEKLKNNLLEDSGEESITLYALFSDNEDGGDDDNSDYVEDGLSLGEGNETNGCDLIELSFLKIILIIIKVGKILIKVLTLVLNIMKAAASIAKDAQLCWINPPCLMSLISYVMQRLSAVIFQIVGMILLKLWAMLNLDCISENTQNLIAEINAALAGLNDLMGSVDSLAIDFQGMEGPWKSIQEMIMSMKEDLVEQSKKVWDSMKDVKGELSALGKDVASTYSNPKTYLAAVPPEISNSIRNNIEGINSIKNNIRNLQETVKAMKNMNSKSKNKMPQSVESKSY